MESKWNVGLFIQINSFFLCHSHANVPCDNNSLAKILLQKILCEMMQNNMLAKRMASNENVNHSNCAHSKQQKSLYLVRCCK